MHSKDLIKTYIPGLDDLLGGGLKRNSAVGILGDLSSPLNICCLQMAFNNLSRGRTVSYHTYDQAEDVLFDRMRAYGWDPTPYIDRFQVIDFYSQLAPGEVALEELASLKEDVWEYYKRKWSITGILKEAKKRMNEKFGGYPEILIVDSIGPMTAMVAGKTYLLLRMGKQLFLQNSVILATLNIGVTEKTQQTLLESLADYEIILKSTKPTQGILEVVKSRVKIPTLASLPYRITRNGLELDVRFKFEST